VEEQIISSYAAGGNTSIQVHSTAKQIVDGIECMEIIVNLLYVGNVTDVEATVKSQDLLVEMALAVDDSSTATDKVRESCCPNKRKGNEVLKSLKSGDPYGAVLWPSSITFVKYLVPLKKDANDNEKKL
jgi:hypothetical protein